MDKVLFSFKRKQDNNKEVKKMKPKKPNWCLDLREEDSTEQETMFRIQYKDGSWGGLIGENVVLPDEEIKISSKTIITGTTLLAGKLHLNDCCIKDSMICNLEITEQMEISNSKISDSYILVSTSSEISEIKGSTVKKTNLHCNFLQVINSELSNFSVNSSGNGKINLKIEDSQLVTEEKTTVEKKCDASGPLTVPLLTIKKTYLSCCIEFLLIDRCLVELNNVNVKQKEIKGKPILTVKNSTVNIKNSTILNSFVGHIRGDAEIEDSVLGGDFMLYSGHIVSCKFYGTFIADTNVNSCCKCDLQSSFFGEQVVFKVDESFDNIFICDSEFFDETSLTTKEAPNGYKKTRRILNIKNSTFYNSSKIYVYDDISFVDTTVFDSTIENGSFENCWISGSARVSNIHLVDSKIINDSLGYYQDGTPILGAISATITGIELQDQKNSKPLIFDFDDRCGCIVIQDNSLPEYWGVDNPFGPIECQSFLPLEQIGIAIDEYVAKTRKEEAFAIVRDDKYFYDMERTIKEMLAKTKESMDWISKIQKIVQYYYYLTVKSKIERYVVDLEIFDHQIVPLRNTLDNIERFLRETARIDISSKQISGYQNKYFFPEDLFKLFANGDMVRNKMMEDSRFVIINKTS